MVQPDITPKIEQEAEKVTPQQLASLAKGLASCRGHFFQKLSEVARAAKPQYLAKPCGEVQDRLYDLSFAKLYALTASVNFINEVEQITLTAERIPSFPTDDVHTP